MTCSQSVQRIVSSLVILSPVLTYTAMLHFTSLNRADRVGLLGRLCVRSSVFSYLIGSF